MKFDFDKEFIEKEVLYRLDKITNTFLIKHWYESYKNQYDAKNLIIPDITNVKFQNDDELQEHYKLGIAKIATENPYAYYNWETDNYAGSFLNPFKYNEDKLKKEIERLTEEEQAKWIKRLGKSLGTLDGKFKLEWVESEKLQWIISKQNNQFYWADKSVKGLRERMENPDANGVPKEERKKWKKYTEFKKNDENLSWSKPLQNWEDEIKNSKWVKIYYSDSKIPPMEIETIAKNSSSALRSILDEKNYIYRGVSPGVYTLFSIHEPKSNFNLVVSLLSKHWKNYPDIHNHEPLKRRDAFRNFWSDVQSGVLKDPEVEMLGFKRYPELKQEESQKDDLEQTQKFEAPRLKMKM
ncbi:hypothetical protein VQY16_01250 [Mesomycoplasma ovipneumoniae]